MVIHLNDLDAAFAGVDGSDLIKTVFLVDRLLRHRDNAGANLLCATSRNDPFNRELTA